MLRENVRGYLPELRNVSMHRFKDNDAAFYSSFQFLYFGSIPDLKSGLVIQVTYSTPEEEGRKE